MENVIIPETPDFPDKITGLTDVALTNPADGDVLQWNTALKKWVNVQLQANGTWGTITGDITAQTDLNDALGLKADLVDGRVPSNQLPGFVDDVLEYADYASLPEAGASGLLYVTLDSNKIYRWSGSTYVAVPDTIALGETSLTAYRGDRGKTAYDHSQTVHDKILVGLGNVDNTADADKPVSNAMLDALAFKSDTTHSHTRSQLTANTTQSVAPNSGDTIALDRNTYCGTFVNLPNGATITFTMANMAVGDKYFVRIAYNGSTAITINWFTTLKWINLSGTAPTYKIGLNKAELFIFICTGINTYDVLYVLSDGSI